MTQRDEAKEQVMRQKLNSTSEAHERPIARCRKSPNLPLLLLMMMLLLLFTAVVVTHVVVVVVVALTGKLMRTMFFADYPFYCHVVADVTMFVVVVCCCCCCCCCLCCCFGGVFPTTFV